MTKKEELGKQVGRNCSMASQLFKTLSNPLRLKILCNLSGGERSVGELEELCECSQSQISQFLKRMEYEDLVDKRRDGKYIFYRIKDERLFVLFETLSKIFSE